MRSRGARLLGGKLFGFFAKMRAGGGTKLRSRVAEPGQPAPVQAGGPIVSLDESKLTNYANVIQSSSFVNQARDLILAWPSVPWTPAFFDAFGEPRGDPCRRGVRGRASMGQRAHSRGSFRMT